MSIFTFIAAAIGLALGVLAGFKFPRNTGPTVGSDQKALKAAEDEASEMRSKAKEQIERAKKILEDEEKDVQENLKHMESTIRQKEELLNKKEHRNKSYEGSLKAFGKQIDNLKEDSEQITAKMIAALSEVSGTDSKKAADEVKAKLEQVITENSEARTKAEIEEFEEEAAYHAKAVLRPIIQRLGSKSSVDKNSTTVTVKEDKFKGLLIGKGGTNITYLESLLPVSIVFNLNPTEIHVGGLNLLRRHIAKGAIQRLQKRAHKTGKIDHDLIKRAVEESEKEIMGICDRKGRDAMKMMDIDPAKLDPELVNYIGRMYFRTSFGQNILQHSLEMAYLARLIAEQIGSDVDVAMQAAFYHDIGKAIDHDVGGSHDDISKEILEKHGFDERIVHAAYAHHDKVPCEAPADFIVKAVDAISAVRPGARQESVTNYFERMKKLEDTAKSFDGIKKVFTMSAGREVRVMVDDRQIQDKGMEDMAENIATKISEELSFPGIIKVNLIRRTKATGYARDKK